MQKHVVVIEAPSPVVTWEDADLHLRLDGDVSQKTYVEGLIAAATGWLDGPGGRLGRALGGQTLEWRGSEWPCGEFDFPYPPYIELVSVKYVDPDGVEQTLPMSDPLYFEDMPSVRGRSTDIRIRYRAGYQAVPPAIKVAILLYVAAWYENREEVVIGASVAPLPPSVGAEALLATYKVYR